MATIYFHGSIGKKYGKKFNVNMPTGRKVIQILLANFPSLQKELREGWFKFVVAGREICGNTEDEANFELMRALNGPLGINQEIHITPQPQGSGSGGGIFMVIAGIVAIAAAFFTGGASLAAFAAVASWSAATTGLVMFGAAMILGGVAMMLTKMPSTDTTSQRAAKKGDSTGFNSIDNMAGQGQAIALIYGYNRIGSSVVSQQIQTLTKGMD